MTGALTNLVRMTVAWTTSNVAQGAIAFATALFVARGLGPDGFGQWTLCMAWAAAMTVLCDLGFGVLLTREAARERGELGRLIGAALVSRLGLLMPAAVVFIAAAPWLAADAETSGALRFVPPIAAGGVAYTCLAAVLRAWPQSLALVLAIETAGALAQCGGAWWMLGRGAGVAELLILAAGVQGAQLAAVAAWWRIGSRKERRIIWPSATALVLAVRRASPFAVAGLVANAQLRVAPLMLGFIATPSAVASFGAAARIGSLVRMLPQAAFAGALPIFSADRRENDERQSSVRTILGTANDERVFSRLLGSFAILSAIVVAAFAGPIVSLAYGSEFAGAVSAVWWIAIGLVPTLLNSGRKVFLYATGHEHLAVRWSIVALAIQIAGCAGLIPLFGAAGAAAALAAAEAAVWWPLHRPVQIEELSGSPVGIVGESPLAG